MAPAATAGGFWSGPILSLGSVVYALRAPTVDVCGSCDSGPGTWRLFSSSDHGATWRRVAKYQSGEIWALAPGETPGSVFVATSAGLFLHTPGHADLERDAGILRSYGNRPSIPLIAASGESRPTLYAATSSGDNAVPIQVYASVDQGRHWHLRRSPFRAKSVVAGSVLGDPLDARVAYAIVETFQKTVAGSSNTAWDSRTEAQLFRTRDSANSWRPIWHGCLLSGPFQSPAQGLTLGDPNTLSLQTCDGRIERINA